jgi:hypothetical protein
MSAGVIRQIRDTSEEKVKRIKVLIALIILAGAGIAMVNDSLAYPPFLPKSKKFGARDCTFCHVNAEGGEPHNERGQWLIKEKERRKADAVDPEWLVGYKAAKGKK